MAGFKQQRVAFRKVHKDALRDMRQSRQKEQKRYWIALQ